jgi:uncharacterized integral membrane protein
MVEPDEEVGHVERHRARDAGRTLRGVIAGGLLVVLVALAVDNRDGVTVRWVFGEGEVPLALVVAASAVAGALLGWLILHRPGRNR